MSIEYDSNGFPIYVPDDPAAIEAKAEAPNLWTRYGRPSVEDIGGKMMEAELLPADRARAYYEDIVRRMKDPALLEYVGRGAFKLRVYPIEPMAGKRVRIEAGVFIDCSGDGDLAADAGCEFHLGEDPQ